MRSRRIFVIVFAPNFQCSIVWGFITFIQVDASFKQVVVMTRCILIHVISMLVNFIQICLLCIFLTSACCSSYTITVAVIA